MPFRILFRKQVHTKPAYMKQRMQSVWKNRIVGSKKMVYSISIFLLVLQSCEKPTETPNIIFIFADDQCYSTVHALGNNEIQTPNLDKLVTNGVTFTHTYNMGAWHGAVCVASRAMLNTGRFVWRAFAAEKDYEQLTDRGEYWGQLIDQAGYNPYMT